MCVNVFIIRFVAYFERKSPRSLLTSEFVVVVVVVVVVAAIVQLCGSSRFRRRLRGANSCCGESGGGGAIPLATVVDDAPCVVVGANGGIVGLNCGERSDNKFVVSVGLLTDVVVVVVVFPTPVCATTEGGVVGAAWPGDGDGDMCGAGVCTTAEPSDTARPSN